MEDDRPEWERDLDRHAPGDVGDNGELVPPSAWRAVLDSMRVVPRELEVGSTAAAHVASTGHRMAFGCCRDSSPPAN